MSAPDHRDVILTDVAAIRSGPIEANAHPAQTFRPHVFPRITLPAQGVWGSADAYLGETQMAASAQMVDAPWRYTRLEGAGHWLPLDRPDEVTRLVLEWLARADA